MKLISWNLRESGAKRAREQAAAIAERQPDLVALQEFTRASAEVFQEELRALGLKHQANSLDQAEDPSLLRGKRRYGVFVASRWPLDVQPECFFLPWPERLLSVVVRADFGELELHTAYVPPGSSNGWVKIKTLNGIFLRLAHHSTVPRILCGDFNTPRVEYASGVVMTWGQDFRSDGSVRLKRRYHGRPGEHWDRGERQVLTCLREFDLPDLFRSLHGYGVEAASYVTRNKGTLFPRRFDHVFAAKALSAVSFEYLHEWRTSGLSDHSAVEVVFGGSFSLPPQKRREWFGRDETEAHRGARSLRS